MTDHDALRARLQEWKSDPLCREAHDAIAALRESNDRWAEINSEQNTRIAVLETTIQTMHDLIGQGALGKAQVIAREALAPAPAPEGKP